MGPILPPQPRWYGGRKLWRVVRALNIPVQPPRLRRRWTIVAPVIPAAPRVALMHHGPSPSYWTLAVSPSVPPSFGHDSEGFFGLHASESPTVPNTRKRGSR
jgi:hypothetical protein